MSEQDYSFIDVASTGDLVDFWRHFRSSVRLQGTQNAGELTDPEFYFCVVRAAIKAGWFNGKPRPTEKALRDWSFQQLKEVAEPIWAVYESSSKGMDDDEKND